jgi:NADPH:quinone reductase-like Zn-dependent oxidoreductase
MKAYELHPEEGFAALEIVDRPAPSALGAHDVRVRVRAVSLNYRDLVVARGSMKRAKPIVPASDGAGEVVAVGEKVTRVKVGERVAAAFFPTWINGALAEEHHSNTLGGSVDGMLAEQVVLAQSAWVKMPSHFSFEQGSTLPCAGSPRGMHSSKPRR